MIALQPSAHNFNFEDFEIIDEFNVKINHFRSKLKNFILIDLFNIYFKLKLMPL